MAKAILKEGAWRAQPAYIVGGGESLRSFTWALLEDKPNVIVINRAFMELQRAAIWFSEDLRVIELYHKMPEWKRFEGLRIFHALKPQFGKDARRMDRSVKVIQRVRGDKFWSRQFSDGLSLSSNSGVGAINLAWLLGADPIYLLGFDCAGQNYHDDYVRAGFDQAGVAQLDTYKSDFENWVAPHVLDTRVVNLTNAKHTSTISSKIWPKWDAESTLRTGMPSSVFCDFTKEVELRFYADEVKGVPIEVQDLPVKPDFSFEVSGRGQEAVGPPK